MQEGQHLTPKYRIVRLLGDGGMGAVYEGRHEVLGSRVAIKILHPELTARPGLPERFIQEAQLAAQLHSPHVVRVLDVDRTAEGRAFIVMEMLEGEPLSAILDRDGKLETSTAVDYTIQILSALEAAHELGIVHRDLKPENVFVTPAGDKKLLKLIDFGIAKARREGAGRNLTAAGMVMGTAEYMAPEQAFSAGDADARSDLYAVGVMLYEMLAGERPVRGETAREVAMKVHGGEVKPLVHAAPHLAGELAGLVHRAMAASPDLRFQSASEMKRALQKLEPQASAPKRGGPRTMLGAPVAEVFHTSGVSAQAPNRGQRESTGTEPPAPGQADAARAWSMGGGSAPGAYGSPPGATPPHHGGTPHGSRGGRRSSRWPWVVVPLFLGVGAAAAWVVYGGYADDLFSEPESDAGSLTWPVTSASASASASAAPPIVPASGEPLVPLQTGPGQTPPGPRPQPSGSPSGNRPPDSPGVPELPPIPSVLPFPIPSGSGLPHGFPTAWPGGFQFPGQPPSQPPPQSSAR